MADKKIKIPSMNRKTSYKSFEKPSSNDEINRKGLAKVEKI